MTVRRWAAIRVRAVLVVISAAGLVACGPREPSTDAEKLARGRELVQQMSERLGAAMDVSVTTTEARDVVRVSGKKDLVPLTGLYTVRRPDRFYTKMSGGRELETWYDGKKLTVAAHKEKVFAQAPMPETIASAISRGGSPRGLSLVT